MSTAPGPTGSFTPPAARAQAHTSGPWTVERPSMGFSQITGPNGELIFGLAAGGSDEKRPDEECNANARLIAEAPAMLAALYVACGYLLNAKFDLETRVPKRTALMTIDGGLKFIRAAIAKAEGTASERMDSAGEKRSSTP